MAALYLYGTLAIALVLPHLVEGSVSIGSQIVLQAVFIVVGIMGNHTFSD